MKISTKNIDKLIIGEDGLYVYQFLRETLALIFNLVGRIFDIGKQNFC